MATPMRPWTIRILELIDEGVTAREDLIRRASASVPLGHAFRARETMRLKAVRKHRERRPDAPRLARPKLSSTEVHRVGARQVLTDTLAGLVRSGRLVRTGDEFRRPYVESASAPHSADEVAP